jgi:hypothetical protein
MSTHRQPPHNKLDAYVATLSQFKGWELQQVNERGEVLPHLRLTPETIIPRCVLSHGSLGFDLDVIAGEIATFGRMSAQARLVWVVRAREFKCWKAERSIDLRKEYVKQGLKPPSKELIQDSYRTHPDYAATSLRVELAEEAYLAQEAAYQAFRAKHEVLVRDTFRARDGTLQRVVP